MRTRTTSPATAANGVHCTLGVATLSGITAPASGWSTFGTSAGSASVVAAAKRAAMSSGTPVPTSERVTETTIVAFARNTSPPIASVTETIALPPTVPGERNVAPSIRPTGPAPSTKRAPGTARSTPSACTAKTVSACVTSLPEASSVLVSGSTRMLVTRVGSLLGASLVPASVVGDEGRQTRSRHC
jgi:hypothetical protein